VLLNYGYLANFVPRVAHKVDDSVPWEVEAKNVDEPATEVSDVPR